MLDISSHKAANPPIIHPPLLTITVDAEEEFDWTKPFSTKNVAVSNIQHQHITHDRIYDRYSIIPTYVIDWPVAATPESYKILRKLKNEGRCEIGTQLHPWVTPPFSETVNNYNSYPGNLPQELEYEKIKNLTNAIAQNFGEAPKIYKAGRYGIGPHTANTLERLGYDIDTSVVPFTSFIADDGPDFSRHGANPFWFRVRNKMLLEIPSTAGYSGLFSSHGKELYPPLQSMFARRIRAAGVASQLHLLDRIKLTPEGYSLGALKRLTVALLSRGTRCFGLTYHSPTLVPGYTSYVKNPTELETFLNTLEGYLQFFIHELGGQTISTTGLYQLLQQQLVQPDGATLPPA